MQLRLELILAAALLLCGSDGLVYRLLLVVGQADTVFFRQLVHRCAVAQRGRNGIGELLRALLIRQLIVVGQLAVDVHVYVAIMVVADLERAERHDGIAFAAGCERAEQQRAEQRRSSRAESVF